MLDERQIERLGSPTPIHVDTRIISATHRDLEQRIAEGTFREDLFYRLNVFPITVPPLRERVDEIPLACVALRRRILEGVRQAHRHDLSREHGGPAMPLVAWQHSGAAQYRGARDDRSDGDTADHQIAPIVGPTQRAQRTAGRDPKNHILNVMESTGWRVRGLGGAADLLGLKPTTLETRLAKLGLSRPRQP